MAVSKKKIVLIGAGNVGHHLGHRFFEKGFTITQVFSRKITKARKLAKAIKAVAVNNLSLLNQNADLYVIAVHDDAIASVATQIALVLKNKLVVHTSGSVPATILKPFFKNYGCFYPLQTFSIKKKVDFNQLPLCIHSPQKRNRTKLHQIATSICPNVFEINDHQKSVLHVAAVFTNNFANHLFHIAKSITEQEGINFDILKPLMLETVNKIQQHHPKDMQTGPAIRGDQKTIERHLKLIEQHPDWVQLYKLLSEGIQKM